MSISPAGGYAYKAITLFAILLPAVPPTGQGNPQEAPYQLRTRAELVAVTVSVTDADGNLLGNLRREHFRVFDDGVECLITHFDSVEMPARVAVILETSPAVYLFHTQHIHAAMALADGLAPADQVALVTYDQAPRLILPFTPDKRAFASALNNLHFNLGMAQLNLFDSLSRTFDWLASSSEKTSIVLLSTGLDSFGPERWQGLADKLRSSDVVIYTVALGGRLRPPRKLQPSNAPDEVSGLSFEAADRILGSLAEISGGIANFPLEDAEFGTLYSKIARVLRHQYRLGFTPPARDGRYHKIEVQLVDEKGHPFRFSSSKTALRVRARAGYLASTP